MTEEKANYTLILTDPKTGQSRTYSIDPNEVTLHIPVLEQMKIGKGRTFRQADRFKAKQ